MGYRKDEIERLKASLAELPQLENVEVSKREAVRLLASTIHGLQGKGYRLDKIAELVSERGVTIKPTTLKSYLHRVKPRGKAAGRTNRRREVAAGEAATEQVSKNLDDLEATPPSPPQATNGVQERGTKGLAVVAAVSPSEDAGATLKVVPRTAHAIAPRIQPNDEAGTPEATSRGRPGDSSSTGEATPAAPPNHQPVDGAGARAPTAPSPSRATPPETPVTRPVDTARAPFLPREDSDDI
jgi:hypothetical protein